jgi:hypothetical protein
MPPWPGLGRRQTPSSTVASPCPPPFFLLHLVRAEPAPLPFTLRRRGCLKEAGRRYAPFFGRARHKLQNRATRVATLLAMPSTICPLPTTGVSSISPETRRNAAADPLLSEHHPAVLLL